MVPWTVLPWLPAFLLAFFCSPTTQERVARSVDLNGGWLFGGLFTDGSDRAGFDDSAFLNVTIPHVVTPLGWRDWSNSSWENVWIYRKYFDVPARDADTRVFLDFDGVLTGAEPTLNDVSLAPHLGGYLPFSYDITELVKTTGNILALKVDSRWLNVNPEGNPAGPASIDYLEPGGISRSVGLRLLPPVFLSDVFARPVRVLQSSPGVNATITVSHTPLKTSSVCQVVIQLRDGGKLKHQVSQALTLRQGTNESVVSIEVAVGDDIQLWSPDRPKLYDIVVILTSKDFKSSHSLSRRIGFRTTEFKPDGFYLNGEKLKIFGVNRHQLFPYGGMSIPPRLQRRDAELIKELNANMVRASHYPQSPHFLDACDELGLMVWEELPGWSYVSTDVAWQQHAINDVHDMIIRDRSRPSIVIWGTQINESPREPELYTETKKLAYALDGTRQVSGTTVDEANHTLINFVADLFSYDDYDSVNGHATLLPPIPDVPYLISECIGELDGLKFFRWSDSQYYQQGQARLHAEVNEIAMGDDRYSGVLSWSFLDYASLQGNEYRNLKWPGVLDVFRVQKPGAAFYLAQQHPDKNPIIQPAFYWDFGPSSPITTLAENATIWSNCDRLEAYVSNAHYATLYPNRTDFPLLAYPPFYLNTNMLQGAEFPDLRLDGYISGRLVTSKSFSGSTKGDKLQASLDDKELEADGIDATILTFRAVDRFGQPRPYARGDVQVIITGPGVWVGQLSSLRVDIEQNTPTEDGWALANVSLTNGAFPFESNGGVGGVLVRTIAGRCGTIIIELSHPSLGSDRVEIRSKSSHCVSSSTDVGKSYAPSFTNISLTLDDYGTWEVLEDMPATFSSLSAGKGVTASWKIRRAAAAPAGYLTPPLVQAKFLIQGQPTEMQETIPIIDVLTLQEAYGNVGVYSSQTANLVQDGSLGFDGLNNSYTAEDLAAVGLTPGARLSVDGFVYTWPKVGTGESDNIIAAGQTLSVNGSGQALGFLGASTNAPQGGIGEIYYTDGTSSPYTVLLGNFLYAGISNTTTVCKLPSFYNGTAGAVVDQPSYLFSARIPIEHPTRTVQAVLLPSTGSASGAVSSALHIFDIAIS
ncbi:glycoside hydrolase [Xylariaceae sp. FL0255]|nr:glycoside hydrolase [Xylariaceae sp. FL0255]